MYFAQIAGSGMEYSSDDEEMYSDIEDLESLPRHGGGPHPGGHGDPGEFPGVWQGRRIIYPDLPDH